MDIRPKARVATLACAVDSALLATQRSSVFSCSARMAARLVASAMALALLAVAPTTLTPAVNTRA